MARSPSSAISASGRCASPRLQHVDDGILTREQAAFLRRSAPALNVSPGRRRTSTGKTTLANALLTRSPTPATRDLQTVQPQCPQRLPRGHALLSRRHHHGRPGHAPPGAVRPTAPRLAKARAEALLPRPGSYPACIATVHAELAAARYASGATGAGGQLGRAVRLYRGKPCHVIVFIQGAAMCAGCARPRASAMTHGDQLDGSARPPFPPIQQVVSLHSRYLQLSLTRENLHGHI